MTLVFLRCVVSNNQSINVANQKLTRGVTTSVVLELLDKIVPDVLLIYKNQNN